MYNHQEEVFFTKELRKMLFSIVVGFLFFVFIQILAGITAFQFLGKPKNGGEVAALYVMYIEFSFYFFIVGSSILIIYKKPHTHTEKAEKIGFVIRVIIALLPFIVGSLAVLAFNNDDFYIPGSVTSSICLFMVLKK